MTAVPRLARSVSAGIDALPDMVFVSMENWDEVWRRNQFLCKGLAQRFPDARILFVGPPRDVSNCIRRGKLSGLTATATTSVPDLPNIVVTRPLKLLPNSFGLGRAFNDWTARRHVSRVARSVGMTRPLLWLNPHFSVSMVGKMDECAVIYDVTDDWTAFAESPEELRLVTQQDAALCQAADAVIVCSERLLSMKRGLAKNVHLIPNGVDVAHYNSVLDRTAALPSCAAVLERPVLGYTGTVHPSRVNVALLEAIARKFKQGSIVLVGPDHLSPDQRARLDALGNVHRLGPVPYAEVPGYMRAFDVSIVPHCVTPFTESLNPIKLWEYLAAGKPIVSTNVAGFRSYPAHVRIAANADEFLTEVSAALAEDPAKAEERRHEARSHSWDSRIDDVMRVIASCMEKARA